MRTGLLAAFKGYASRLRFPKLVALTLSVLVIDVLVPDAVPLADEILLALITALLASFKKRTRLGAKHNESDDAGTGGRATSDSDESPRQREGH